jgi:glycosidase
MGEVIHGDYRGWANPQMLDSVTNYEVYKSLYSSHVDRNYFELAYALNRQSGEGGIYRDLRLVNFADNHDVDRVASRLDDPRHLYPLHILLFTIPGIPSVYYGSEWGISGRRSPHSDLPLRPSLDLSQVEQESPNRDLAQSIRRLAGIRQSCGALRGGYYQQLEVRPQQFAFARQRNAEASIVLVNAAAEEAAFDLRLPPGLDGVYRDLLSPGETFTAQNSTLKLSTMPVWGRILVR